MIKDRPYWENRALLAREIYWSSMDELDRATKAPGPRSLSAWIAVAQELESTDA